LASSIDKGTEANARHSANAPMAPCFSGKLSSLRTAQRYTAPNKTSSGVNMPIMSCQSEVVLTIGGTILAMKGTAARLPLTAAMAHTLTLSNISLPPLGGWS